MDLDALVLFADARGFTRWANQPEVFARLDEFAASFDAALRVGFPRRQFFYKGLGDGAMLAKDLPGQLDEAAVAELLDDTLARIGKVEEAFREACVRFAHSVGQSTSLNLGWGVVRGPVRKLKGPPADYVGPNVNKCARLCSAARPFGVIIDREDFPTARPTPRLKFFPQSRRLTGIVDDVAVWVTEEIATQFLTREQLRQTPEVHVAGQCVQPGAGKRVKILVARRSPRRRLYGGNLEGCGGQLAASETFAEGVVRHFKMEMGIDVRVLTGLHCFYVIREPEERVIPGIRFLCEQVGDAKPKSVNHDEVEWLTESEFRATSADQFVPGLKEEVLALLDRYKAGDR